jgi:hypothetical protein
MFSVFISVILDLELYNVCNWLLNCISHTICRCVCIPDSQICSISPLVITSSEIIVSNVIVLFGIRQ